MSKLSDKDEEWIKTKREHEKVRTVIGIIGILAIVAIVIYVLNHG